MLGRATAHRVKGRTPVPLWGLKMDEQADRLMSVTEVCAMLGVSESWWYRRMREGTAPAPFRVGNSRPRYTAEQVRKWVEQNATFAQKGRRGKQQRA